MKTDRQIKSELAKIDWNFVSKGKPRNLNDIHPYPAKFIPEIPNNLIRILNPANDCVIMDPFCGSGVTLLEAQNAGYKSIGIDLNPIACLISRVKTGQIPDTLTETAEVCIKKAKKNKNPKIPHIPNLQHWYTLDAQNAIAALLFEINSVKPYSLKDALRLCLSSILVKVSNQESDTRYAAINKEINYEYIFECFRTACKKLEKNNITSTKPAAIILQSNLFDVTPKEIDLRIGLVITSPPYPNAYEYWLYHKYRMWWLGFDPIKVKEEEIGARAHFFKKNSHTKNTFQTQMNKTFSLLRDVTVPESFACFVVGSSLIHGEIVDNSQIVTNAALENDYSHFMTITRTINPNRKSFNLAHARIKKEDILIFKKA